MTMQHTGDTYKFTLPSDAPDWHPSDAYDWNLPGYDPTGDPYFEVSDE